MKKLIEGLHRFQTEVVSPKVDFFENLAKGQAPETMFITCSDSRIDPALMTQTTPGDLFVIRNAGNIIPPVNTPAGSIIASIEFGVKALGVSHIVVCGHSHCGAVKGVLSPDALHDLPLVKAWLTHAAPLRETIQSRYAELDDASQLNVAVQENVLSQLENLQSWPFIQERIAAGRLQLHGWVYKIETGVVFGFNNETQQFEPITNLVPVV